MGKKDVDKQTKTFASGGGRRGEAYQPLRGTSDNFRALRKGGGGSFHSGAHFGVRQTPRVCEPLFLLAHLRSSRSGAKMKTVGKDIGSAEANNARK